MKWNTAHLARDGGQTALVIAVMVSDGSTTTNITYTVHKEMSAVGFSIISLWQPFNSLSWNWEIALNFSTQAKFPQLLGFFPESENAFATECAMLAVIYYFNHGELDVI